MTPALLRVIIKAKGGVKLCVTDVLQEEEVALPENDPTDQDVPHEAVQDSKHSSEFRGVRVDPPPGYRFDSPLSPGWG